MEDRQRDYILLNLENLVHQTYCSAELFSSLLSDKILSNQDVNDLIQCRREKGTVAESTLFYNKCIAKPDSFEKLINALLESKQTEPLEILKSFYRNTTKPKHSDSSGSLK